MARPVDKLMKEAASLPRDDRTKLVEELLRGLDEEAEPDIIETAPGEIASRIAGFESGQVLGIPWEEARSRLHRRVNAKKT